MLPPLPPPKDDPPAQPIVPVDEEDEDDDPEKPFVSKSEILDERTQDILSMQIDKQASSKAPPVSALPAPAVVPPLGDPELEHAKAPIQNYVGQRKSYVDLFMNSTVGRSWLFVLTMFITNCSILGLVNWNKPEYRKTGDSWYLFFTALFFLLMMYTLPLLSERAGMSARETGWKPYLVLYRLSFIMAIPACVLQVLGRGTQESFGDPAGDGLTISALPNTYWTYFELTNGFVGLNLTKGIVETLSAEVHGVLPHRRKSRFRDAELRINFEPFTDFVEPTETPGRLATYRIAPIFDKWAPCVSRYRISSTCLAQNPVRGWAMSVSTSICSRYKSVACKPPKPYLEPIYQCSKDHTGPDGKVTKGIEGKTMKDPISGLCGHVGLPPPEGAIDELGALLLYDAWPKKSLPKASDLWLDVAPDPCIGDTEKCKEEWSNLFLAGLSFQILTNLFLIYPCIKDCRVDKKIREARKFMTVQEKVARFAKLAK